MPELGVSAIQSTLFANAIPYHRKSRLSEQLGKKKIHRTHMDINSWIELFNRVVGTLPGRRENSESSLHSC